MPWPSALLCDLLDAPTALAACCGFDLCHKYILYLYLYLAGPHRITRNDKRIYLHVQCTHQIAMYRDDCEEAEEWAADVLQRLEIKYNKGRALRRILSVVRRVEASRVAAAE